MAREARRGGACDVLPGRESILGAPPSAEGGGTLLALARGAGNTKYAWAAAAF